MSEMHTLYAGLPPESLSEGIKLFIQQGEELAKEIGNNNNLVFEDRHQAFHSMKTMSRMVGAMQLGQICEQAEDTISSASLDTFCKPFLAEWSVVKKLLFRYQQSITEQN
jgi:HPt (histidine-containing phosphotransfer) domain-containing protein